MERLAQDALQRAALDGLVGDFVRTCRIQSLSSRREPFGLRGDYGTWTFESGQRTLSLTLTFAEPTHGALIIRTEGTHLSGWKWTSGDMGGVQYIRIPSGLHEEKKQGGTPGPLPADLFDGLWNALYAGCHDYVWHLNPDMSGTTLFPAP